MECCPLVDPCVFLCMAQLIIGDFLIGFFHRCLLGAVCTSEKKNIDITLVNTAHHLRRGLADHLSFGYQVVRALDLTSERPGSLLTAAG